ncbi:MAG: alcohol dehydrogenase catalytic domain-containing protein, partial [bacterium]|nr:alcohol dehydrogenase catalytic domain-containing protein [bacterium]
MLESLGAGRTGPEALGAAWEHAVVVEAAEDAVNRRTNRHFEAGEPVCAEEMAWCGTCRPCADGYPNHCEALQEIGF